MKHIHSVGSEINKAPVWILWVIGVGVLALFVFPYYGVFSLSEKVEVLNMELASTTLALDTKTAELNTNLASLRQETLGISSVLSVAQQNILATQQNVASVQSQVGGVAQTVGTISGAVNTLEKLSKTDPELLQKYSKVFFLNEHYAPERVVLIPVEDLYNESRSESIHASVWPYLNNLLLAAKASQITLYIKSAYRPFDEQMALKSIYAVTYGVGTANQFSADQGYSEHQLGTTVDFITSGLGGQLEGFDNTPAYQWLLNNAYRYGFILSYPKGNTYYVFEPWHWRYVGVKLATDLHNQGKSFYDLEQREIDAYLVNIFD